MEPHAIAFNARNERFLVERFEVVTRPGKKPVRGAERCGHRNVAVLEFYSRDIRPRDDEWFSMLASVNVQVEQSLRRRQMEQDPALHDRCLSFHKFKRHVEAEVLTHRMPHRAVFFTRQRDGALDGVR